MSAVTRPRLTVDGIVDAALVLLDDEGIDQLTTINLARRLGVTQPALYGHVRGLDQLRSLVAARGAQELSDRVRIAVAGRTGDEALQVMAHTYRDYVREHPDRYLIQVSAIRAPEYRSALELAAEAVREVLRSFGLSEEQVLEAHVAFRAAVHGFVHLEAREALAARASADEHFEFFVQVFSAGLHALATSG
jgi:AcrR family transcriptional regulator